MVTKEGRDNCFILLTLTGCLTVSTWSRPFHFLLDMNAKLNIFIHFTTYLTDNTMSYDYESIISLPWFGKAGRWFDGCMSLLCVLCRGHGLAGKIRAGDAFSCTPHLVGWWSCWALALCSQKNNWHDTEMKHIICFNLMGVWQKGAVTVIHDYAY